MRRAWILACAILAGCTTYQPQPLEPAQLALRFEQRSLTSEALRGYLSRQLGHPIDAWPLQGWDRTMLTLAAGYYSPALDIARARWDTAKTGTHQASARPNPVLQFPFEYATHTSGSGQPYTTGPAFDIPIETAGKRSHRVAHAAFLAEAARLNVANEAWKLGSQVRDGLLGLFAETQRGLFLTRKLERQQQIVAMWRRRQQAGEAAGPDVRHAQIVLAQAQSELAAATRAQLDGRARLATTVGVPFSILYAAPLDLREFEQIGPLPPPAAARRAAIFERADLRGALAEYEATQAALQLEIAKQYPDVHLGLGYIYDVGTSKFSLGLAGITLPLLDDNQGAIAQAEARRKEAAARFTAFQDSILIDVEHALAVYRDNLDALHLSATGLAASERQLDSQTAHLAAGAIDRLALAQAQADHQTSAIDHLNALVAVQQAAAMLEDTMQRRLSAKLAPPERDNTR